LKSFPLLSICVPTYNRPEWLKRALVSITTVRPELCQEIEIIVSDDSSDSSSGEIAQTLLRQWPGEGKYTANCPRLGMAQNWNHSITMASGEYIVVLHDDDFFIPGGVENLVKTLDELEQEYPILLFGVKVVNDREQLLKMQTFPEYQYLSPRKALINLLSNSSFIRFPAIAIQRKIFNEVGYFDPQWGEPTDLDMWIRLFSRYGVYCIPLITCAYTVHSQALTMGVFNEKTLQTLLGFFERVASLNLLSSSEMENCKTKFFHQFILAGAFRMLRRGRFREFHQVMQLLKLGIIKDFKPTKKWKLVRIVFEIMDGGYSLVI
jgi:glycosyltransferase involved in cell wall biosynthesis